MGRVKEIRSIQLHREKDLKGEWARSKASRRCGRVMFSRVDKEEHQNRRTAETCVCACVRACVCTCVSVSLRLCVYECVFSSSVCI